MLALILALHVHIISYAIRYSRVPPYLQRAEEFEFYQQLFAIASPDGRDALDQQVAANFLAASHLPQEMLHQIWHFATSLQSYTQEYLTTEGFFLACRLVAWAQNGGTPLDMVHAHQPPPLLPDFPGLRRPALLGGLATAEHWRQRSIGNAARDSSPATQAAYLACFLFLESEFCLLA